MFFVLSGMFTRRGRRTDIRTLSPIRRPARTVTPTVRARRLRRRLQRSAVESVGAHRVIVAFVEGSAMWGAFAYIGADLQLRFG